MIYCASCGTANREGSVFCNNCGLALPKGTQSRTTTCAKCATENDPNATTCANCGAALAEAQEASAPASAQSASSAESEENDLPSWLLDGPLPDWINQEENASPNDRTDEEPAPEMSLEQPQNNGSLDDAPAWLAAPEEDSEFPPAEGVTEVVQAHSLEKEEETTLITGLLSDEDLPEWLKGVDLPVEETSWPFPKGPSPAEAIAAAGSPSETETTTTSLPSWAMEETSPSGSSSDGEFPWSSGESSASEEQVSPTRRAGPITPQPPSSDAANLLSSLVKTPPTVNLLAAMPENKQRSPSVAPTLERMQEARAGGGWLVRILLVLIVLVALAIVVLLLASSNQIPALSGLLGR